MTKEKEVILTINGKSHILSKPLYVGGGKHVVVCPKCSLYKTHFKFCWKKYYGDVRPLCSILAESNGWDNDFMTYFQKYKNENN